MPLPELGIGMVYVPGLEPLLEARPSPIDFIEIEPQTLWHHRPGADPPYRMPAATLSHLRRLPQRKVIHSVGFAPGGTEPPDPEFVAALSATIEALDAPWASEHLSVTHLAVGGRRTHASFMLPCLQTPAGAACAARSIRRLAAGLPVPFAVETAVNYLAPRDGELDDGEFVRRVVESADCGILLDLHNIWTNARNGRQPVEEFLAAIPLERVWEVHLAGGYEFEGYWLDAHSGEVPAGVMALAERVLPTLPNLRALVLEVFPTFLSLVGLERVAAELERIRALYERVRRSSSAEAVRSAAAPGPDADGSAVVDADMSIEPADWEQALGATVLGAEPAGALAEELAADPATALIRKLIWRFRAGAVVKSLSLLTQLIRLGGGEEMLERLLNAYFASHAPQPFASEEGAAFLEFVRAAHPDVPYLDEVIAYEAAAMDALLSERSQSLRLGHDPRELVAALQAGRLPADLTAGRFEVEIEP